MFCPDMNVLYRQHVESLLLRNFNQNIEEHILDLLTAEKKKRRPKLLHNMQLFLSIS